MRPDDEDFDDEDFDGDDRAPDGRDDDPTRCGRCGSAFDGRSYRVRVEAEPDGPGGGAVEIRVCPSCMESLARWTNRRPSDSPRGSRRARRRRTPYTDELDRHAVRLHQRPWLILAGSCAVVFAVIAMIAVFSSQIGRR